MTLMEMMIGNFQADQGALITQMSSQSERKSNNADNCKSFSAILKKSINSSDNSIADKGITKKAGSNENASRKVHESADIKTDSTPKYRSFREISSKQLNTSSAKKSSNGQRIDDGTLNEDKIASDKKSLVQNVPEDVMQLVAKLFGINVLELEKLLKEAGITPESFNSLENISTISSELAQVLGLNSDQQRMLEIMLQTAEEVMVLSESPYSDENAFSGHIEKVDTQSNRIPGQSLDENIQAVTAHSDFMAEQISEQIKMKLDEYGIRLEEGEASVEEDLKTLMLPMLEKTAVKLQPEALQGTEQTVLEGLEPELTAAAEDIQKETSSDSEEAYDGPGPNAKAQQSVSQQSSTTIGTQTQPMFSSMIQANQIINEIPAADLSPKSINTNDILSQIIEKANINLTPEKSEVVMELKPESLGKISLKVVTENGIVMAKFVAENQQVREVLETNMQLLKDSLQKQGLNVQGFSVSVRQNSDQSARNRQQYDKAGSSDAKRVISGITGPGTQLPLFPDTSGRNSSYMWETSTINLTA